MRSFVPPGRRGRFRRMFRACLTHHRWSPPTALGNIILVPNALNGRWQSVQLGSERLFHALSCLSMMLDQLYPTSRWGPRSQVQSCGERRTGTSTRLDYDLCLSATVHETPADSHPLGNQLLSNSSSVHNDALGCILHRRSSRIEAGFESQVRIFPASNSFLLFP
jgi:hypothetical protein